MPKADKFDFIEYSYAKKVHEDFPKIISVYKKLLPVLYHYAQYSSVWHTIQAIEDSLLLAEMQQEYYNEVYKNKGKMK